MDQQRLQAYMGLIEQLLGCPQGQEEELLRANRELVDAGLLTVMEQVAALLENQESSNAQWLRGLATQVAQTLGLGTPAPGNAKQFLLETLWLVAEKEGNPQQIYPVWAQQQAQFNAEVLAALPTVAAQLLEGNSEQQTFIAAIAAVLGTFGNLINQFPLGTRWLNLELGIAAYEQALTVRTQSAMPIDWATTTMNLATAYSDRIRGDRADNLEQSIGLYEQSLTVITQSAMPVEWAQIMNNLASTYCNRIRGDRAENLEQSIGSYEQSLTVRTQSAMPVEWATTINNLAIAYRNRIQGDRADNIEQSIGLYKQALTVMTQSAMPVDWATTTMNLANAHYSRIRGDRADNIEQSIGLYKQALTVMTQSTMPVDWATTTMNLATAYRNHIRGDRATT